jgi:hypothetical protein
MADTDKMDEVEPEPNVLFLTYGKIVDSFFADGKEVGDSISVIPSDGMPHLGLTAQTDDLPDELHHGESDEHVADESGKTGEAAGDPEEDPVNTIVHHVSEDLVSRNIPAGGLKKTQRLVDSFRRILSRKSNVAKHGQEELGEDEQLTFSYLKEFRVALGTGDETLLEANPFYDLTKQIYKLSLDGVNNAFQAIHEKSIIPLPNSIFVSRSLKGIWSGATSARKGFFDKLSETFGKWIAFFRTPLSLLLFVGSTYTTARGVNDLLQMPEVSQFFGSAFEGREGEPNRYILSLSSGLILSSAILDYKTRIFQSMVEAGSVLTGIKDAFLRNPRWMIIAALLAVVSIKTNYDGIVSIISKKEDLAQQSQIITGRVRKALGSPFFMNALEPDSLFDLQASFQQTTQDIRGVFRVLPEDEVSGVASSGDPRKGPRYWAKHFIVHGGYESGINDVKLAFNNHGFASKVDDMLKNSGIDFSSSFSEKVELLRAGYEDNLRATDDLVHKRLGELNILMSMGGYSMDEIKRVLALEHYQINDIVQNIVGALEANKEAYKETAEDLNELTNTYLGILQMVDKSGVTGSSAYQIKVDVSVPRIEAIDQLRDGKIPIAKHKNFEELRNALMLKYGISLGGLILGAVLFFSISMDFGDPIVFSGMTARRGKKDRVFYKDRLSKLKMWEEEFFTKAEVFFQHQEVRAVFLDSQEPGETMVRNAFYKLLESINPELRDQSDKSGFQKFDHWFQGMFRFSRTTDMAGLNNRLAATRKVMNKRSRYFPAWGSLIYPDFQVDKAFTRTTLHDWHDTTQVQLNDQRVAFYQELRDASKLQPSATSDLSSTHKRLTRWADDRGISGITKGIAWSRRAWYSMFHSTAKKPIPSFGYTRRGWLNDFSENSLESEKIVESIYGFIPDLKKVVFETLPSIQEEYLEPVLDFLDRFPSYESSSEFLKKDKLQQQFDEIEKEALDLWGVSFFASDDPGGYLGLSSIIGQEELANIQEMVEKTGTDSAAFSKKVSKLASDMEQAFIIISTTDEMNSLLTDVRTLCVNINQSLMKIKMRAWEYRSGGGPDGGSSQYLDTAKDLQFRAPKEADSILSVMEAVLQSIQPYTKKNLVTLRELKRQAADLHDRIMAFVELDQDEAASTTTSQFQPSPVSATEPVVEESAIGEQGPEQQKIADVATNSWDNMQPEPVSAPSAYSQESAQPEAVYEPAAYGQEPAQPETVYEPAAYSQEPAQQEAVYEPAAYSQEPAQSEAVYEPAAYSQESAQQEAVYEPAAYSREPMQQEAVSESAAYSQEPRSPVVVAEPVTADRGKEWVPNQIRAIYETSRGAIFEGPTGEIAKGFVEFVSATDPAMLPIGNEGTIQLSVDDGEQRFPGKVARVSDNRITVRILADKERFEALTS